MTVPRILVVLLSLLPAPLRRRLILWMLRRLVAPGPRRRQPSRSIRLAAASAARAVPKVLQTLGTSAALTLELAAHRARMGAGAFAMAVSADLAATLAVFTPPRAPVPSGAAGMRTRGAPRSPPRQLGTRNGRIGRHATRWLDRLDGLLGPAPRHGAPPAPSP